MISEQNPDGYVTVKIPRHLHTKIATRLVGSVFTSVDEWIVKLIETEFEPHQLPESDEAKMRKRLKSLGYE